MIYITNTHTGEWEDHYKSINFLWEIEGNPDVDSLYREFIMNKAKELDITINPKWLNIMNFENHHPHLSKNKYKQLDKQWSKILKKFTIDAFIKDELKGKTLDFVELN